MREIALLTVLKVLRFDGKTNWLSFKKKFDSYRKVMRWSEEES